MALELVTGYWGQNHVTAEQEADLNAGIFGSGFYVLPVGEKMRAEAVTSNQVRIFDGIFVGYGRQASIEEGGYENVTIENGTAGLLRNDMIVIKYNKDEESGIESVAFDVLKGQTGSTAQDPVPNNQDIRAGAFESEMPLYRVKLNGLAIEAIEPLFTVPKSIPELMQDISDLEDENAKLNSALTAKDYSGEGQINGFESWAVVDNHTVTFCIRGTVATNLGTSDQYAYVASFPQLKSLITLNRLRIKRIEIMPTIKGQIRFEQDTGILRIGYTYNNSGLSVDIPEGTALYLEETFVL